MKRALLLAVALAAFGCISPKLSYVQPGYPRVRYEDLAVPATPRPVQVSFVHLWDGERKEQIGRQPRRRALAVLARSRLFSSVDEGDGGTGDRIHLALERFSSREPAPAVFGSGTYVHNRIVLTATLQTANATSFTRSYEHAIHSSIGHVKRPPVDVPKATYSMTATGPSADVRPDRPRPMFIMDALDEVTEVLLLTFLRDLQADGRLR